MKMVITKVKAAPYKMEDRDTKKPIEGVSCMLWGFKLKLDNTPDRASGRTVAYGFDSKAIKGSPEAVAFFEDLLDKMMRANGLPIIADVEVDASESGDGKGGKIQKIQITDGEYLGVLGQDFTFSANGNIIARVKAAETVVSAPVTPIPKAAVPRNGTVTGEPVIQTAPGR